MTAFDTQRDRQLSTGQSPRQPRPRRERVELSSVKRSMITLRDSAPALGLWLKDEIAPPNLVVKPLPTLQHLADYAYRGPWTKEDGVLRLIFGKGWLAVTVVPIALLMLLIWVLERPTRFAACAFLAWLIYMSF